MREDIKDIMVKSGGGHEPIHAKRLKKTHPLFDKLFPYRWNPKRHNGARSITVVTSVYNWITSGREIKEGQRIYHIDGNNHNDNIDNLVALTSEEQCKLMAMLHNKKNKGVKFPKGLVETYIELIRLNIKLKGREND